MDGGSSSRRLPNWILMRVDEIYDIRLLDRTFPGGRPTSSGNHIKWDKLFIRVKPADDHQLAGPQPRISRWWKRWLRRQQIEPTLANVRFVDPPGTVGRFQFRCDAGGPTAAWNRSIRL